MDLNGGTATRGSVSALLFLTAGMTTFDAFSTLNSSPWTAESFGADPRRAAALREYVRHAIGFSMFYAVLSALIANSTAPLWGAGAANVYLWWLYRRAEDRAVAANANGWADGTGAAPPATQYGRLAA
jgi:hypothetical protein